MLRTVTAAAARATIVLAFDFGLRRIGVAQGNTLTATAAPLTVVEHREAGPDWQALDQLMREHQPSQLVVGLPYNVDGSPGALMAASNDFAAALAARYRLPVARVDERYSSREASGELAARRRAGARRRRVTAGNVDQLAAAIILERWLGGESRQDTGN